MSQWPMSQAYFSLVFHGKGELQNQFILSSHWDPG